MWMYETLRRLPRSVGRATALLMVVAVAGCDDDDNGSGPGSGEFNQVQRLGKPLVSEVILAKRNHPLHASIGPNQDTLFIRAEIKQFLAGFGRSAAWQDAVAGVLLPDMLIVDTSKDPATAGYLSSELAQGYGGRKLADDVVDLSLTALFGDPLGVDPAGAAGKAALTTDNVATDSPFTTTFPYLAPPN